MTRPGVEPVVTLFDAEAIARRVEELAGAIAKAVPRDVVVVGLLKGSFVFLADLVRALDRRGLAPRVDFLWLASYGHAKESSGEVRLVGPAPNDLQGRCVVIVDDIVDSGRSLAFARSLVRENGAAKVWTCALLDKPSRRQVECPLDFVGFTVPNVFVVGYGIDFAEGYRHLPYIGAVE